VSADRVTWISVCAECGARWLRWEYRARNLKKVPGMGIEADFNEHGAAGWEFCAVADGYAIYKRPVSG
jgi:hypothetical protein